MAIHATRSRYDAILMNREKQRYAAELREARSEARRQAAQQTLARSDTVRFAVSDVTSQINFGQSQLTAQLIRSRMSVEAAQKAAPTKWYRS
ncbi:hypothetical protein [Devosia sp. RR2S18]|uniref:hypothetical protein n=1 Tax=Devosia rhizosphaerae TaxID=3049774 RepID=UPI002541CDE8|nr:hypothetical protein [Devosia sp. RR2S18]WIJ27017.1 hypothetical protein QOV41_09840 [Devosia sp. RR2S18]